jgi:hypothetical protein
LCLSHLLDIEVGNADPADFALFLKPVHCLPVFRHVCGIFDGPMNLVQVNGFNPQPPQTVFALALNRTC